MTQKVMTVDWEQECLNLEDRILWASSETVVIPKDMKYPKLKQSPGLLNFFKSEINKIAP